MIVEPDPQRERERAIVEAWVLGQATYAEVREVFTPAPWWCRLWGVIAAVLR